MPLSEINMPRQYKLTVFANFSIDNNERFLRLKDSFSSFCDILPDEWVVNVRGSKRNEVAEFLAEIS